MFNIFGKNDWYPVWSDTSEWLCDGKFYSNVSFEIIYSPSRKIYKIKMLGITPKKHPYYSVAVRKLNEFIKNGHE